MALSKSKKIFIFSLLLTSLSLFSQRQENLEDEPKATRQATGERIEPVEPPSPQSQPSRTSSRTTNQGTTDSSAVPVGDKDEIYINSNTSFELRATDDSSMVDYIEYRINNGELIKYTNPITISTEGISQITYRAVDKAGNIEAFKLLTVIVDNTPPTVTLVSEEPFYVTEGSSFTSRNNTFSFRASDALSGVQKIEYAVNEGAYQEFNKDNPFRLEKDGINLIRYHATDNAGNRSRETSVAVTVDNRPPKVEIIPATPLVDIDGKIYSRKGNSFSIRANDSESGVRRILYKMTGDSDFRPYVEPIVVNTGGDFTIEAKAIDNVGNESEVVSVSFSVDVNPPQSIIKKLERESE